MTLHNKLFIWIIFTIFEEDDIIKIKIWSYKSDIINKKLKITQ